MRRNDSKGFEDDGTLDGRRCLRKAAWAAETFQVLFRGSGSGRHETAEKVLEKLPITISKRSNCTTAAYANATHDPVRIDANIERFQERVVDHIFSMKVSDGMHRYNVSKHRTLFRKAKFVAATSSNDQNLPRSYHGRRNMLTPDLKLSELILRKPEPEGR